MLEGNEAAYVAYLEEKVAAQKAAAAATAAATAAKEASDKAAQVLLALDPLSTTPIAPPVMLAASSSGALKATIAVYTMSGTAPEAISGFRGAILTKDGAEARVYTDIEDAVATHIGDIYQSNAFAGKPAHYSVVTEPTTVDQEIPWSEVKRPDNNEDVDRSVAAAPVKTFAGSVSGLAGVFSCTAMGATACAAPTRGTNGAVDGAFSMEGEDWTFAPTDPNGTIDVADNGYVQFGWWLNMKGDDVGDGFDVDTFASAPGMTASLELEGGGDDHVTGSATYTGGAAGKWAIASTTEDTTEGGHFTATATLGVNFDAHFGTTDDVVDKDGVSVSGMITDFMTGNVSRPDWRVTMTVDSNPGVDGAQPAMTLPATTVDSPITGASKWTTGGAVDGMGTWSANFYGREDDTMHPTAVVGTFDAAIANGAVGRIQGAFGATK